jgi:hypothetical protein
MAPEEDVLYFIVLSNPTEGDDDEYNRWYSRRHITDVLLQVDGVKSVQRFTLSAQQRRPPPYSFRYMALYQVDRARAGQVFSELQARSGTEVMPVRSTFDPKHIALAFEPITPLLTPETAADFAAGGTE